MEPDVGMVVVGGSGASIAAYHAAVHATMAGRPGVTPGQLRASLLATHDVTASSAGLANVPSGIDGRTVDPSRSEPRLSTPSTKNVPTPGARPLAQRWPRRALCRHRDARRLGPAQRPDPSAERPLVRGNGHRIPRRSSSQLEPRPIVCTRQSRLGTGGKVGDNECSTLGACCGSSRAARCRSRNIPNHLHQLHKFQISNDLSETHLEPMRLP